MRFVTFLALLFCVGTLAWSAEIKPIPVPVQRSNAQIKARSNIRPITELRQIKFKVQPVVVKSPGSETDKKPRSVIITPDAETVYKTGSGIVFNPASLKDFLTGSVCSIHLLNLTPALLEKIQNKEPDIEATMTLIDQAHSSASNFLCSGTFYSIPQGMHTYVFTCRLFVSGDVSDRLWFCVGDQQFGPDKQTVNTTTNEISLIYTYQPKDQYSNYLNIGAYLKPNETQSTYSRGISFWYMQLAQLN
jgi:hypothetical protein